VLQIGLNTRFLFLTQIGSLSIARGIGATRGGAILSSAREEAALDLFSEQAIWPAIMVTFRTAYEVLHQAGFSDEAILYEMYLSEELPKS
jgi:ketol-acid reductoisomerase